MRYLTLGAVLCMAVGTAAGAGAADAQLAAPIQKFIDSFNKGAAAAGADLVIIDEVSPYLWRGPQAFQAWGADLDADAKKKGITDQVVTISAATREETNGEQA